MCREAGEGELPLIYSLKGKVSLLRLWYFKVLIPKQISQFIVRVFNSVSFWAKSLKQGIYDGGACTAQMSGSNNLF